MKRIKMCATALFVALAATTFSSCTSTTKEATDSIITYGTINIGYYVKSGGEFLDVFDVIMYYARNNGYTDFVTVNKNEVSETTTYGAQYSNAFNAKVYLALKMKSTVDKTQTYDVSYAYGMTYSYNGTGSVEQKDMVTLKNQTYDQLVALMNKINSDKTNKASLHVSNGKLVVE